MASFSLSFSFRWCTIVAFLVVGRSFPFSHMLYVCTPCFDFLFIDAATIKTSTLRHLHITSARRIERLKGIPLLFLNSVIEDLFSTSALFLTVLARPSEAIF